MALALVISGAVFELVPGVELMHTRGHSMEPGFKEGDVVLLRMRSDPPTVKKGDIVLFNYGVYPISHRVIEVGPDEGAATRIVTQGDNNPRPDKPITRGDIEATLIVKLPLLGEISRAVGADGGVYVYRYGVVILAVSLALVLSWKRAARIGKAAAANRQRLGHGETQA